VNTAQGPHPHLTPSYFHLPPCCQPCTWPLLTLLSPTLAPPVILGDAEELVEEVTVNANSTVSLQCPALGNPAPTLSWLQNGLPFSPSPRLQVLEEGHILKVRTDPT
jgi:hypothetical protein